MKPERDEPSSMNCDACVARKKPIVKRGLGERFGEVCRWLGGIVSLIKLWMLLKSLFDNID